MLRRKSVGPAAGATVGRWRKMGDNRRKPHTMCSFKPLRVSHTTGNFCYTCRVFCEDTVVVHSERTFAVSHEVRGAPGQKRCAGCGQVLYCGHDCQTAHWTGNEPGTVTGNDAESSTAVRRESSRSSPWPGLPRVLAAGVQLYRPGRGCSRRGRRRGVLGVP